VAGVDEVGRGALAGPVVAAAVILDGEGDYEEYRDSKTLTPSCRERLAARIRREARAFAIGMVSEKVIDRIDILRATQRAMRLAVRRLSVRPDMVLVDGFWLPGLPVPCIGIVGGDARSYSIAAASIVAKVTRDGLMRAMAASYPQYGFDRNMGYGTPRHLEALARFGPCRRHRLSFRGVPGTAESGGCHGR
jgi:ribonuclease HII